MAVTAGGLRYHQEYDTDHPEKGRPFRYRFQLGYESLVPSAGVSIRFAPGMHGSGPDVESLVPESHRMVTIDRMINCPTRGVYVMGVESLRLRGLLNWVHVRVRAWTHTFYVYPRLIEVHASARTMEGLRDEARRDAERGSADISTFAHIAPYRPGDEPRYIDHRAMARTGEPAIRHFAAGMRPGVVVYLDRRPVVGALAGDPITAEDVSLEIVLALTRVYLAAGIPVTIRGGNPATIALDPSVPGALEAVQQRMLWWRFDARIGPEELRRRDQVSPQGAGQSIVVTHSALSLPTQPASVDREGRIGFDTAMVVFNATASGAAPPRERRRRIAVVHAPEAIVPAIEGLLG